ncbi:MAG: hypothetical protein NC311_06515 [Muribaculaceae bacterium]|nr:hypothetical protein [Muribaculaceae bacterium]
MIATMDRARRSTISEATSSPGRKEKGLWVDLLDVERFINMNALQPVTNPVFIDKRTFTTDGVLSNEIFGVSQYDRKNRFAYIDLAPYHYMNPLAAVKLASYDRKLSDILYARGTYKLTKDGALIEDPDGDSGPEFLYRIWGKVKVKDKTTETTKEVQKFFEKPKEQLFLTKFPVIPPFYRDINVNSNSSSKSSNIINSKYSSIISYTQSMASYTNSFGNMTRLTQARVQTLMVEIYQELMVKEVKGQPSKFGMLRRSLAGKNLPYTARLVITAPNLNKSSLSQVQVKFGYATIPLAYICSLFMPFMIHNLKDYFEGEFIRSGKYTVASSDGKERQITFQESYDENAITGMINKFINSPGTRFDPIYTPPDVEGKRYPMMITGRFNKDNTSFSRKATFTDILYIVALKTVEDKHVYITRYPMDNPNGQNPYRIIVATTNETKPVTIGDQVYEYYPVIKGDPMNAFMSTGQFSNTMIGPMGADFDGDQVSVKACWTKEANDDAERYINSNAYVINIQGKNMREITKDFLLTQYMLTNPADAVIDTDCNVSKPKYALT